jgi:hypothetical protein
MAPKIIDAAPLEDYIVRVAFADGAIRDVDFEPLLEGEIFQPLRDRKYFAQVRVSDLGDTIEWPNGADLDPEVLYGNERPAGPLAPRVIVRS